MDEHSSEHEDLWEYLTNILERLNVVENVLKNGKPPGRVPDALNDKILDFMSKYSDMKWTANVIAENIGEDNSRVGTRLQSLGEAGKIIKTKSEGKVGMYQMKKSEVEK